MNWKNYLSRKLYRKPITVVTVAMCAIGLLNLPYERVQRRAWTGQLIESKAIWSLDELKESREVLLGGRGWEADRSAGRYAGWPDAIAVKPPQSRVSIVWWAALKHNAVQLTGLSLMFAIGAFGMQAVIFSLRSNRKRMIAWRHATIVSSLLLCFTGTTVGCHRMVFSGADQDREIASRGILSFSTTLPSMAAGVLPEVLTRPFLTLESAVVTSLRPGLIDRLSTQGSLDRIVLRDCVISRRQWQQLVSHPTLKHLCFERCQFEPSCPGESSLQWRISELNLKDCSGLQNIKKDLPHAASLRFARLQAPAEALQFIVSSLHRSRLEKLELALSNFDQDLDQDGSHTGVLDHSLEDLEICAFEQLETLSLLDSADQRSNDRLRVSVDDCPRLNRLSLGQSRWWDLELSELPRLTSLVKSSSGGGEARQTITSLPTVRSLRLRNVLRLNKLELCSAGIERLDVEDCPAIHELVLLGEYDRHIDFDATDVTAFGIQSGSITSLQDRFAEIFRDQAWLNQLHTINLAHSRLQGVDLTLVTKLKNLKKLELDHTGIEVEQLTAGRSSESLQHLSLLRHELTSQELNSLLDEFPNLKTARFRPSRMDELVLVDRPQLESLDMGARIAVESLTIQDCPKLSDRIQLSRPLRKLHIQNVPSLEGLTVDYPVPADTVLEGVRDLEHIRVMGEFLTDNHLKEIVSCRNLDSLYFAAPNVSPAALRRIGGITELKVLVVPGTQVDDSVVRHWTALDQLYELDLSHTSVTKQSLCSLKQSLGLQRLLLNHTKILKHDTLVIQNFQRLFHLELSGVGADAKSLALLLSHLKLDRLDLSDTQLDEEQIAVLCSSVARRLPLLMMKEQDLSPGQVFQLTEAQPQLSIEAAETQDLSSSL